ncbi:MAG: alpha-N-arabinofuranosidase [Oscillospiraceae bacterium]|nr:alpha-N-arabinofuranosidase [Oscillospiraceae bacterium]
MKKTVIDIRQSHIIGETDSRLFGSFIEHLGRAVYGGIYEPSHPLADHMGFRQDVLGMVKALHVPVVRYPGGNFVSGYHWEDGIGPKALRPRKKELAWKCIEPNWIGIDEFQEWAKRAETEIIMAVNLGTGTPEEAGNLVEYCNCDYDTYYVQKRRENGFEKPFGIHLWCLGNEMDGEWQICRKTPEEYARIACETAKIMKWTDPSIELIACGSSHAGMPTFGEWERCVLRECYPYIEYLSIHSYYGNQSGNTAEFLAKSLDMDAYIQETVRICDEIQEELQEEKKIYLAFDEWNVWFHSNGRDKEIAPWQIAPPLLEDIYTMEDALLTGCLMMTLMRNCSRVKIACLAQLVNVIAPIMTRNHGPAWAQTIYYPFLHASLYGRGRVVEVSCQCESYTTESHANVPELETLAVIQDEKTLTVFIVNRSGQNSYQTEFHGTEGYQLESHIAMYHDDIKAENTEACPDAVTPCIVEPQNRGILMPYSWNVLRFLSRTE